MFFDTSPWGQFALDIFLWTSVNETLIYDESNILKTSCQIKLWNFLLQLEMTKKTHNFLSESFFVAIFLFTAHHKNKNKLLPRAQLFNFYVIKFRSNVFCKIHWANWYKGVIKNWYFRSASKISLTEVMWRNNKVWFLQI